jgi:hypothetical protein
MAASILYLPNIASVSATEALAMREGLALANRLGCNNFKWSMTQLRLWTLAQVIRCGGGVSSTIFADCVNLASLIGNVTSSSAQEKPTKLLMN